MVPFLDLLLSLLALIFGIVALRKIAKRHTKGKGFALSGIILGAVALMLSSLFMVYFFSLPASSSPSTANAESSSTANSSTNTNNTSNSSTANSSSSAPFNAADYQNVSYDDVARDPETYEGKLLTFTGTAVQIVEGSLNTMRLAVNGNYDEMIMVTYDPSNIEKRILEDDNVQIYGMCSGLYTYESVMGASISIPGILATKIEIASPEEVAQAQVSQFAITIDGCRLSTNYAGNKVAIISMTFTNNSNETTSFMDEYRIKAFQNGIELDSTYVSSDNFDSGSQTKDVQPGGTLIVQKAFELSSSSTLKVEVKNSSYSNSTIIAEKEFAVG